MRFHLNLNQFKSRRNWNTLSIKFLPDCYVAYSQNQYGKRPPEQISEAFLTKTIQITALGSKISPPYMSLYLT